jgi:hypothetical protein
VYAQKDAESLFASLPLICKLFPLPLEPLLPADSLKLKGEMTLARRKQHTSDRGMKWFSTGEIDLMLSILSLDGRYEDAAFILPVHSSNTIKSGFSAHARLKALLQLEKDNAAMPQTQLAELIFNILKADSSSIKKAQQVQQDYIVNHIIERNPGLLSKKVLVFPQNENGKHWSATFVFNPGSICENVEDIENSNNSLRPCFFRYCSIDPLGTRQVAIDTGIIWFLNLCYSNEIHEESMPASDAPMKWLSPFGKKFEGNMLGTKSFPALCIAEENMLPKQEDGCNCGLGIVAAIGIILRNICSEKVEQMSFNEQFGRQTKWELHEDDETKECFAYFDRRFFEALPTKKDDLIFADYLTMLRLEWFVVFDRMAALHFDVLPKRVHKDNLVNPLYTDTLRSTLSWPDFDSMKKRQAMPKGKLRKLVKELEDDARKERKPQSNPRSTASAAIDITQSPDNNATFDLSSPGKKDSVSMIPKSKATIDLSSPDRKPASTNVTDADVIMQNALEDTPVKINASEDALADKSEEIKDTPTKTEGANEDEEQKVTIKRIEDLSLLTPVVLHVHTPTKKRKGGDLLKRLQLDDVLFEDNDEEPKGNLKVDEDDDNADYTVLSKEAKMHKVSTQSTGTIEAFYRKYHATPATDDTVIAIDKAFKTQLATFIAESFKKWKWSSEKDHQKTIEHWAKKMKAKDCSESKREWIRELIKGIKEERAQFTKELTNEFMFTRLTMVKGLRFEKANNSFYARLVYQEPDESHPNKMVVAEEELKVEEEWVRSEYAEIDIQHIINMHQTDKWTDVPRDVEVRIAKHKVVRVRYVPPQVRHVLDYEAMAKVINEKDVTNAKRRKKLGFDELQTSKIGKASLMDQAIPRRRNPPMQYPPPTPSKIAKNPTEAAEKKRLEKEEAKWQKSIIRKPVSSNCKWVGRMENNKETNLEEEFVGMAFGEAFVKELKLSGNLRGFVDVPVGDYKPSHLHHHPNLQCSGAPAVHFNQTDGKDLCVSKSLASALFSIGFHEEASIIDNFGEEILRGAVVDALENVVNHARSILPSWIVIRRLPHRFDWKAGLDARHLLLGVLSASDGSCCHAVCIHGGYVYDANETVALPLCDEALNYCTSTPLVKSTFVGFRRGYIFCYEGQRKQKLARMTLQA